MKIVSAKVTNATLTPGEFRTFMLYLYLSWPCAEQEDGMILQGIPVDSVCYYPQKTENIVSAEEFFRKSIRDVCIMVLTHHSDSEAAEKSYHLQFHYSDEIPDEISC